MERSGSQKVLLVLSILNIVVAVLGLIVGIMAIAGGALFGAVDDCDLYRFLKGDMEAVNAYRGEYMRDYPWAILDSRLAY